ncbi:PVC-type heme-binding CxxCH protein [Fuerstiella marisgermanici]|uniref:Putative membrane-bound dehydrogenase domain protein n=1 Tax=Fuerstiella marisgermanici TaxID=1891926 RepID=A0A1P8WDD1_9PLAN|nr:putative membrane-bound dehydrogenase domain protein [Fuerstiella marisgermanici]
MKRNTSTLFLYVLLFVTASSASAADLKLLFMGDNGHHRPEARFQQLAEALEPRGVDLKYTDRMEDLSAETLGNFDGLVLYANIDRIEDAQARAVLDYVASGKGFIPLHCATYCWRNNADMVALMGAQFLRHGGQVFTTSIAEPQHPIMKGYGSFTSWDETYIHHRHNEKDRTVLEFRIEGDQADGNKREPWTWVRTHGKGRVFYTAWGHDERTFGNAGFQNLVERGIRWACGEDPSVVPPHHDADTFAAPQMTQIPSDVAPFEYMDVGPKIPNYTPGQKWGVQGKPRTTMQQPLSPEESLKHYVTPEGMAVRLYADERNFVSAGGSHGKPIAMTWDERGRLWVCETVDYPNELGKNRDRIRICEDTDGDHVADKFTVFAEGLSIPTAIVIIRGGAVVQNGTETIYLKDTDGDDKADQKTQLITNWALGDTHGGVSNFRYGLDNWVWAMQGYNNSTPHVDGKPAQTFRMGFWRFKLSQTDPPKVTDLEFIRSSNNNTWGLGISEDGLIFGSTANHNPSMFVPIPNRYYESVRGWSPPTLGTIADTYKFKPITENIRQVDQFGGYTAGAGHALYTARAFPKQYWNKTAFVCGPTGHLVGTFVLRRDGANYTSTSPCNLLASDDEWSAPIMAEVGPDGAVWVIDWYNYIVQHNPTPQGFETGKGNAYESDLRDKKHGRILRVVPTATAKVASSFQELNVPGAAAASKSYVNDAEETEQRAGGSRREPATLTAHGGDVVHEYTSLADATDLELVETLKHPSLMWRLQAQRLLIERNAGETGDVLQPLLALLADESVDEAGLNVGAIHALQTLKAIGYLRLDPQLKSTGRVTQALAKTLRHPSAAVRRNAISVLPNSEHGEKLLTQAYQVWSRNFPQVHLQTILKVADMPVSGELAKAIVSVGQTAIGDAVVIDALTAAAATHSYEWFEAFNRFEQPAGKTKEEMPLSQTNAQVAKRVAEHVGRSRPTVRQLTALLKSLRYLDIAIVAVDGLTNGLPDDYKLPTDAGLDAELVSLLDRFPADAKGTVIRLATRCGSTALDTHAEAIVDSMLAKVNDSNASDKARIAAARDLIGFRPDDADTVAAIVEQLNVNTPPELGVQLLNAIQQSRSAAAGEKLVEAVASLTPQLKSASIGTLLSRPEWAKSLLAGIEARDIELSDLTLDQKQSLRAFPDKQLREQAEKLLSMSGGLPDANREKVLQSLLHLCEQDGNVEAGLEMFKKHCSKCHRHGELGKNIGPNLTGMAVHPKAELLTHIIDPSRSVEGNFRIYTVVRTDGRVANGMLASETRTSITLIDTEGKEASIQREDIDELLASKNSLMPEGFEKQMTETELSDLLQFLTNKGKYVPVPLDRYATAISTKGLFHDGDNGPDRMVFADWNPKFFKDVPFLLTDPRGKTTANIILLNGPHGTLPPTMPKSVTLPCNTPAKAIHLLSGVGGWSYPSHQAESVSMIVRVHYADGTQEDHPLKNGVHFADYIRRVDVPGSEFAFALGGQQIRHLAISPERPAEKIATVELVKGNDPTAPIVMAVTIER